jgi:hypothetical protein
MANLDEIIDEMRATVAAMGTSRDPGQTFLSVGDGTESWDEASPRNQEAFVIERESGPLIVIAFGEPGSARLQANVVLRLGHHASGTELERERWAARDIERIQDVLSMRAWTVNGVDAVFEQGASTDRSNAQWWVSELVFRVVYTRELFTS